MTVYLVGAGPGDPELLTMKAARLVQAADTIVYDRLVSPEILSMAPLWAELIDVGKDPNGRRVEQVEINQTLIDRGAVRDTVVRLKGGDPFVFGRGGEEFAELAAAGIAVEARARAPRRLGRVVVRRNAPTGGVDVWERM